MSDDDLRGYFINQLRDRSHPEDVVESAIFNVQIGFFEAALVPLLSIVIDDSRSTNLRRRAAYAIRVIGSNPVKQEIVAFKELANSETKQLLDSCLTP